MRVEAELVQRTTPGDGKGGALRAWKALFGPDLRDRTAIGILVMFFQRTFSLSSILPFLLDGTNTVLTERAEWSGINALLYYGPTLVRSIGLRGNTVTLVASGGIGVVQFVAVVPAILFIDRLGECLSSVYKRSVLTQYV
jgi:hypothetical protein